MILVLFVTCSLSPRQKAMSILQEGLKHESIIVRVSAAKGLRLVGDTKEREILYEIATGEDKVGSAVALDALYDLREVSYSPAIVTIAERPDPQLRINAYKLISLMNDERCYDILIKGTEDFIAKVRRIAYSGLEKFEAKNALMNGLRDVDPLTRIAAAQALGRLGEKEMMDFIRGELKEASGEKLERGIIALAEMGDTSAIPLIEEYLYAAPWEVRLAAIEALLILHNDAGIDVLKQGLRSDDPFTRVRAVQILKEHKIQEATQLFEEAVQDEYTNVVIVALEALAEYGNKEHRKIFAERMDASNPLVQIAAATAYLQAE